MSCYAYNILNDFKIHGVFYNIDGDEERNLYNFPSGTFAKEFWIFLWILSAKDAIASCWSIVTTLDICRTVMTKDDGSFTIRMKNGEDKKITLTDNSVKREIEKYLKILSYTNRPFRGITSKIINYLYRWFSWVTDHFSWWLENYGILESGWRA